ncbi:MAG TPA: hypothetical protein VGD14_06900 [bacterium]
MSFGMILAKIGYATIEKLKPIGILMGDSWFRLIQGYGAVQDFA